MRLRRENYFLNLNFVLVLFRRKVPKIGVRHALSWWIPVRVWPARECRGPRTLAMGRGKGALAAQLVGWCARGSSGATKSYADCYTAGHLKSKVP